MRSGAVFVQFDVLGPVRVGGPDGLPPLSGKLRLGLLSLLLARANTPVPAEELLVALWGERRDAASPQRLQTSVHKLRKALVEPGRLTFDAGSYLLRVKPDELDSQRFDDLVARAEASPDPEGRVELLRTGLSLWRGNPFQGVDLDGLVAESHRLTERRHVAFEALYTAELERGRHAMVIAELTDLVNQYPLREHMHALLMTALYRSGRQAEALAAYQRARGTLIEELGLEPGPGLRSIERQVLAGEDTHLTPAISQPSCRPAQLPQSPGDFVGRRTELATLHRLSGVDDTATQLVVVTGEAGVGKTALVTHWAHQARERFPDGQLHVDLHGFSPHDLVPPSEVLGGFLRAMGDSSETIPPDLTDRSARFRSLTDDRKMLVVLDNAASVEQVRPLLPGSSSCHTVVTSRDSLTGLAAREGAASLDIDRMPHQDARDLLSTRIGQEVGVHESTARLIEHCARLPLALRVAAERLRARRSDDLSVLVAELDVEHNRLDLLETGDEQTSMRAVLSWSYRQLPEDAAHLFRMCGFHCLHPGHYLDAYAAASLLGTTDLRTTRRLLDLLVRSRLLDKAAEDHYLMHDLVRMYATELAEEHESNIDGQRRLLSYYLDTTVLATDLVHARETDLRTPLGASSTTTPPLDDRESALSWLGAKLSSLTCAAEIAATSGLSTYVVDLATSLWPYLDQGRHLDEAQHLHATARTAAQDLGDRTAEGIAVRALGIRALRLKRYDEARSHLSEALALHQSHRDASLRDTTRSYLAIIDSATADPAGHVS